MHERRLGEGDVSGPIRVGPGRGLRGVEVFDEQVVALGLGVLEIGQRIDSRRKGRLPGGVGQLTDHPQRARRENRARLGLNDQEHVVVLGEGLFDGLECKEVGVVGPEKDTVVVGQLEVCSPRANAQSPQDRDQ